MCSGIRLNKNRHFCGLYKKTNFGAEIKLFTETPFFVLHKSQKISIFREMTLWAHGIWRCIREILFWNLMKFLNMFLNTRCICNQEPKWISPPMRKYEERDWRKEELFKPTRATNVELNDTSLCQLLFISIIEQVWFEGKKIHLILNLDS